MVHTQRWMLDVSFRQKQSILFRVRQEKSNDVFSWCERESSPLGVSMMPALATKGSAWSLTITYCVSGRCNSHVGATAVLKSLSPAHSVKAQNRTVEPTTHFLRTVCCKTCHHCPSYIHTQLTKRLTLLFPFWCQWAEARSEFLHVLLPCPVSPEHVHRAIKVIFIFIWIILETELMSSYWVTSDICICGSSIIHA